MANHPVIICHRQSRKKAWIPTTANMISTAIKRFSLTANGPARGKHASLSCLIARPNVVSVALRMTGGSDSHASHGMSDSGSLTALTVCLSSIVYTNEKNMTSPTTMMAIAKPRHCSLFCTSASNTQQAESWDGSTHRTTLRTLRKTARAFALRKLVIEESALLLTVVGLNIEKECLT